MLLSAALSCATPGEEPVPDEALTLFVGRLATDSALHDGCSHDRLAPGGTKIIVPINRDVCVGCANLGWLLREWDRSFAPPEITLVTPESQVREICEFLRRERASAAVMTVVDAKLPAWWSDFRQVLLIEALPGGGIGKVVSGFEGDVLLNSWRVSDPAPAQSGRPPDQFPQPKEVP